MTANNLPPSAKLKMDLMFEGIRYTDALGEAAQDALPNYSPYRFQPGEPNPTGAGTATIPYLMTMADGTEVRIRGNGASSWRISGERTGGYRLHKDGGETYAVNFEAMPAWRGKQTGDGFPMAKAGIGMHGDMAIINVAPGCQYFLVDKRDGGSMRCTFCTYGAPDIRTKGLGQDMHRVSLLPETYDRLQQTLAAVLEECTVGHIYLVGGSMTDWREEGTRFIELARRVQEVVQHKVPVTCGSGALPQESLNQLHAENLVDNVCFNLEVWSEPLFAKICPGKQRYVGFGRWIDSLEAAVALWGRERVYSAMVAGVELEPEHGLTWQAALDLALEGAEYLCARGIIPVYSLYWPVGGRDHRNPVLDLPAYFEKLNLGTHAIRKKHGLRISDGFMCHHCAYMQLECDVDRGLGEPLAR